jgi:steroid delta-isomerase-like uncharacterized protein
MSAEDNKRLLHRSVDEFWNTGNVGAIDQLYATNYVGHDPSGANEGDLEHFKQYAQAVFAAFPDLRLTLDDVIAEGDKVVKRWTARCTHTGEFMGVPATGNKLEITGTTTYRVGGGKFVESWWNTDTLGMMQQMGVIPPLGEGG